MKSAKTTLLPLILFLALIQQHDGEAVNSSFPLNLNANLSDGLHADAAASKENTFKEFYIKAEKERSKSSSSNPSVDEIISGIIQLMGGNVNLSKQPPSKPPAQPAHYDQEGFGNSLRINNRGPAFSKHAPNPANLFHPSVLIGPGPSAGLPLPNYPKINKPPPHLPPKSTLSLQERNLSAILGHKLAPLHKDSYINFRRVPGNTILPKPLLPQRDRDGIGSQLQPDFLAPPAFLPDHNAYSEMSKTKVQNAADVDKQPNSLNTYVRKKDADSLKESAVEEGHKKNTSPSTPSSSPSSSSSTPRSSLVSHGKSSETITATAASGSETEFAVIRPTPAMIESVVLFESTTNSVSKSESGSEMSTLSEWLPVGISGLKASKTWSEEPPMIITQEEPVSVFDITMRHKLGASIAASSRNNDNIRVTVPGAATSTATMASSSISTMHRNNDDTNNQPSSPIATKELFADSSTSPSSSFSSSSSTSIPSTPPLLVSETPDHIQPTRSRPHDISTTARFELDDEIVYGKPVETNRPVAPSMPEVTVVGSGVLSTSQLPSQSPVVSRSHPTTGYHRTPAASLSPYGRPIVVPVDMDDVRPKMGSATASVASVVTDPGQGSVYIDGRPTHFKIRHAASPPTLQVGSGVSVKPGPNDHPRAGSLTPHRGPLTQAPGKQPAVRRPPFRPRPVVPLVRIDTCIVGDETTCDVKMNERCKTEIGISSCQCKHGFGRSTSRGMCNPIVTLAVSLRLDKLGDNKLTFNRNYMNPNSEEYQFLEYETIQGFNSMFALSRLAKVFMGVRVNKFYSVAGKLLVNASIDLEQNNATKAGAIKRVLQQELGRVIALSNSNIGDSLLWVDSSANSVPRVEDINECASSELNDCSAHATCTNEFGSFRCACKKGYDDKFASDVRRAGRSCSSCSPQYCSNRGECHIVDGERECRCRGNFIGSKCDIDVEVLGVAVGGSVAALVIIVITFLCLYMWNQKWKAEQQKIEAMSAASAQTFSYMTKQQQSAGGYRYAIDDRYRWAQVNETNFYSQPEHILASSQQHVYATPSRVQTPNALVAEEVFEPRHNSHYSRPSRSKSRNSTMHGHHYQASTIGPGSLFNETEFSTRETIYTPSHLIMTSPRSKYAVYS